MGRRCGERAARDEHRARPYCREVGDGHDDVRRVRDGDEVARGGLVDDGHARRTRYHAAFGSAVAEEVEPGHVRDLDGVEDGEHVAVRDGVREDGFSLGPFGGAVNHPPVRARGDHAHVGASRELGDGFRRDAARHGVVALGRKNFDERRAARGARALVPALDEVEDARPGARVPLVGLRDREVRARTHAPHRKVGGMHVRGAAHDGRGTADDAAAVHVVARVHFGNQRDDVVLRPLGPIFRVGLIRSDALLARAHPLLLNFELEAYAHRPAFCVRRPRDGARDLRARPVIVPTEHDRDLRCARLLHFPNCPSRSFPVRPGPSFLFFGFTFFPFYFFSVFSFFSFFFFFFFWFACTRE